MTVSFKPSANILKIDGDGKADYLCMEKDSRVTGFLNKGQGNFQDVGQIKLAIDVIEGETAKTDRANMRWADVS